VNLQRWARVQDLFHQALACDESERDVFLQQQCQGDSTLLADVQSLISCHQTSHQLWDHDRWDVGLKLLVSEEEINTNKDFGNYTLNRMIGRGGMGDVYLASDKKLGRRVALKLLPKSLHLDDEWSSRFHEEARAASSIAHPNVAHIYELGSANDREYIAMEFIDGVTVRERLKQGPIELTEAVEICEQVGRGIAAAHSAGVLHRDIKPDNIMLAADGFVKVLDFGLAKISGNALHNNAQHPMDSNLTSPGVIMGTAAYMSPEQLCGEQTDIRTDIWSLGVTLYEMICGHQPFRGKSYGELKDTILIQRLPSLRIPNEDHAARTLVKDILNRALQKNKEYRYQCVDEFVNDLRRVKLVLNEGYGASTSRQDHTTAAHLYPRSRLFQRTSEFTEAATAVHHKERLLTFSIFLLISLGFFGLLLATDQMKNLFYKSIQADSQLIMRMHPFIGAAVNLLGGFAVGRVASLIKISKLILYPFVMVALVLSYAFHFLTFHWLPSLTVFAIYSLPYVGVALFGASIAFRPWSRFRFGDRIHNWSALLRRS
jgi:serine/threonine protein kinase